MTSLFAIPALICVSLYCLLILAFSIGWLRTRRYQPDQKTPAIHVSILIPCRNEEENIRELANLLNRQVYPAGFLEIIWIDDHSTDGTASIIEGLIKNRNKNLLTKLTGECAGKKAALQAGMRLASGELILLTDADSRPGNRWVQTMANFFSDSCNVLDPAPGWFDQVQKLEYLSLVASSIGAAGLGMPIMAQGPNIGVRAADYAAIVNNLDNRFASGDDVFLLQAMTRIPGKKTGYVLNPDAIVRSKPVNSVSGFLKQRQRWASKASGYRDPFLIITTVLVLLSNLAILMALFAGMIGKVPFSILCILVGIKTMADLLILTIAARFFRCTMLLGWFIPVQFVYPAFIIITGILSQVTRVRWKGSYLW
jgi:cellulose synthase/poly-beta-1,6-N-acetylglucosamine synthase-like glycosyltransferase